MDNSGKLNTLLKPRLNKQVKTYRKNGKQNFCNEKKTNKNSTDFIIQSK